MIYLLILVAVLAAIILLIFFSKKVVWWEIVILVVPISLIIFIMQTAMVAYTTGDTEYLGFHTKKIVYYEAWDEKVSCSHSYDCNCSTDSKGNKTCSTCYEHLYDVDYHPEHWVRVDNTGYEYEISKSTYNNLKERFATKTSFVELNRNFHSIDGNAYRTDWGGEPERSDIITKSHSYTNKIQASHSIFKFENIDEKTKKMWGLYDYPLVTSGYYQPVVLGNSVNQATDRKLQYINGYYGLMKQFRMYILFFKDKSMDVAFKQRSYWEGGNKNELLICIGMDKSGSFNWVKCFSWMDKPELEVEVQNYFNKNKNLNLSEFADWLPNEIVRHWHRKQFKDFDYLQIELTETQIWWVFSIVMLYTIICCFWIVTNEFDNEEYKYNSGSNIKKPKNQEKYFKSDSQSFLQKIRKRYYGEY